MPKPEIKVLKEQIKGISINPACKKINSKLREITGDLQKIISKHEALDKLVTIQAIKLSYDKKDEVKEVKGVDFIEYANYLRDNLEKLGQYRTYKRYKTVISKLSDYIKHKELEGLLFIDVNTQFLTDYKAYLKGNLNNKDNTIHNNLKTIRAIYYQGIKAKMIDQANNPFFTFKLQEVATKKIKLTLDEFNKIRNLELDESSFLNHARNSFVFSYFNAGIRIGDLMLLKWVDLS